MTDTNMRYTGTIDSEESFFGVLSNGDQVIVWECVYEAAPKRKRRNPEYWAERIRSGEFDQEPEVAYVKKVKKDEKNKQDEYLVIDLGTPDYEAVGYYIADGQEEAILMALNDPDFEGQLKRENLVAEYSEPECDEYEDYWIEDAG